MTAIAVPAEAFNLMNQLTRQIERVAVIRERYYVLGAMPGVDFLPLTRDIDRALETAHEAAASGDALAVIRSLQHLQSFEDWGKGKLWELTRS